MQIIYQSRRAEKQFSPECKDAWKYSDADAERIEATYLFIVNAESLQDLRLFPPLHLEIMKGRLKNRKRWTGEWSIRVVGTSYRGIFIPCDDEGMGLTDGDVLKSAATIKVLLVTEVMKHYE